MTKRLSYILGILTGAVIFGGGAVLANTEITAVLTSQIFYLNGVKTELEAYNINGYNYVRLRDAAGLFGVNVEYDAAENTVYLGERPQKPQTSLDANIFNPVIDGSDFSKEDYSRYANQSIFDNAYSKAAYNAVRQTIIDKDNVLSGNNENGYNSGYNYAHFVDMTQTTENPGDTIGVVNSVFGALNSYYTFTLSREPGTKNYWKYPGYSICEISLNPVTAPARNAADSFAASISHLSDREKAVKAAEYICEKLHYDISAKCPGLNGTLTAQSSVGGVCGDYAPAFSCLCAAANIPCVIVKDSEHAWNEVYIDGQWEIFDVCNYDTSKSNVWIFATSYPRTSSSPQTVKFAKELLVPGSTK